VHVGAAEGRTEHGSGGGRMAEAEGGKLRIVPVRPPAGVGRPTRRLTALFRGHSLSPSLPALLPARPASLDGLRILRSSPRRFRPGSLADHRLYEAVGRLVLILPQARSSLLGHG